MKRVVYVILTVTILEKNQEIFVKDSVNSVDLSAVWNYVWGIC